MTTPELIVAERAARAAGDVLRRYFREGVAMRSKDVSNLVSDADLEAERAIVEVIRRSYPDHVFLGEEIHKGDVSAEHLWVIDPLDGTNNFAHKVPHFAVSIAYYRKGVAECGVITNPVRDEWYVAARGQGAFHDGRAARVAEEAKLDECLVGVGFYYDRGEMMRRTLDAICDLKRLQTHGIRRFGTAALDLAMVGTGLLGAYFEYTLSPGTSRPAACSWKRRGESSPTRAAGSLPLARTGVLASNGKVHRGDAGGNRAASSGEAVEQRLSDSPVFIFVGWVERSEGPPSGDVDRRGGPSLTLDPPYQTRNDLAGVLTPCPSDPSSVSSNRSRRSKGPASTSAGPSGSATRRISTRSCCWMTSATTSPKTTSPASPGTRIGGSRRSRMSSRERSTTPTASATAGRSAPATCSG